MKKKFDDISLLITHYNRSSSLERLLSSFDELKIEFGEVIISDDSSSDEHVVHLKNLAERFKAKLVLADENQGLGNNINKGQDAVTLPYTLYVQEDFKPKKNFVDAFVNAADYMKNKPDLDVVRLYAYRLYPHIIPFEKGFGLMNFKLTLSGYGKFYAYSDHPHLRRSSFFEKFGRYKEGYNPEQTEYRMMMAFLQRKGKGLFYIQHKDLFDHGNTEDEPSTMTRHSLKRSNSVIITFIRNIYRHLKFNLNYMFGRYI